MRLNVKFVADGETLPVDFRDTQTLTKQIGATDYNELSNKPTINSVVLEGALTATDLGLGQAFYDSSDAWNAQRELIAEAGVIYIYSDYYYEDDGNGNRIPIAGLKIGDGTSYLIDMPFVGGRTTQVIINHLADSTSHVSSAEKEFWNNKISCYIDSEDDEILVLSKTSYENNEGIIVTG